MEIMQKTQTLRVTKISKRIPKRQDILRIQYMIQNKTQVGTVNVRLYFKVIFRQNEIQYFTTYIYTTQREREHLSCGRKEGFSKRSET